MIKIVDTTKFKETTARDMKTAGILYIIASMLILIGHFPYLHLRLGGLIFGIILVILALFMILIAVGFLILSLTEILKSKPELSSPINFARFGLVFYLIFFSVNIMDFFGFNRITVIVITVLLAVPQLLGFIKLNSVYHKISRDFTPPNRINSGLIVIYGSYGIIELIFNLIKSYSQSYQVRNAFFWVDLILGFIVMLALGIVLTLNSEKLLKQIKSVTPTHEQPSTKAVAETVAVEEAKYCDNCGNKLLVSDKFCPQCGATVK